MSLFSCDTTVPMLASCAVLSSKSVPSEAVCVIILTATKEEIETQNEEVTCLV